jgi:guanine deaminase
MMEKDTEYIIMANDLALKSINSDGGPFGAVIVKNGIVIAEGMNCVVKNADPTAHAEILAIRGAAAKIGSHNLKGCTLYASCEPCPMCLGAIYWARIEKVVYSSTRLDAARSGFDDDFIYNEIALNTYERKVKFVHNTETDGKDVFNKWKDLENKIPY